MLDIGWSEFLVIGVVALIVIGPRELPVALRALGRFVARARALANDFREGLDDIARETELKNIEKTIGGDLGDMDPWSDDDGKAKSRTRKAAASDPEEDFDEAEVEMMNLGWGVLDEGELTRYAASRRPPATGPLAKDH